MNLPGKYDSVETLKAGQNASVFRARNRLTDRKVFLKVYSLPEDDEQSALREPQRLANLSHVNLTRIFSADEIVEGDKKFICLEMELLSRGSMDRIIDCALQEDAWPDLHQVLRLVIDVSAGLGHMHSNGYVHRDVKPANLMLKVRRNAPLGVVTDLGLAARLNHTGRAFANAHARLYRPPEAWLNKGYSPASDVYQLGLVLFQLLGGEFDYSMKDLSDAELSKRICNGTLVQVDSLGWHVSRGIRKIVERAIHPEEAKRFSDMTEFGVALHNALKTEPGWAFEKFDDCSEVTWLREKMASLKLVVESEGEVHTIQRWKRRGTADWRRSGAPEVVRHHDLAKCRDFQNVLGKLW